MRRRLPVEDMAAAATRLLLAGNVPSGHRQRFIVNLVERQSTSNLVPPLRYGLSATVRDS
jgi:hypothetical protein